jgi:DNA-binding transcriptional MerR regulator
MPMRIRELARRSGTTTRTLRYYESQGLLPAARTANGYRVYEEHHVRLVKEVRSLQKIGFSLEEARPFVECLLSGHESGDECPASIDAYRHKLSFVDRQLSELEQVHEYLATRLKELENPTQPLCEFYSQFTANDNDQIWDEHEKPREE